MTPSIFDARWASKSAILPRREVIMEVLPNAKKLGITGPLTDNGTPLMPGNLHAKYPIFRNRSDSPLLFTLQSDRV